MVFWKGSSAYIFFFAIGLVNVRYTIVCLLVANSKIVDFSETNKIWSLFDKNLAVVSINKGPSIKDVRTNCKHLTPLPLVRAETP